MRISDWSSDVCSSDLEQGLAIVYQEPALLPDLTVAENMRLSMPDELHPSVGDQVSWAEGILARWSNVASIDPRKDRKSVVQGKSGSVRVDLGGRRIIKKKNNEQRRRTKQKPSY